MAYDEIYRLQYHFSPASQWLNDPNGLVYYEGEYHLFYQRDPDSATHGPMHWGHAVSTDLVNWTHLPVALYPDVDGYIYSGSAVIDWQNTAGFGTEAMVAIFTHHLNGRQSQSIAYSTDMGRCWTKYEGNPVIRSLDDPKDFRDPKVIWFEESGGPGYWVMLVAAADRILIYSSPDLKHWSLLSTFGPGWGCTEGVWETPELFKLPVGDGPDTRWVLSVAVGNGAPAGGTGVQYFVGYFDGSTFTSENHKDTLLWVDYGADFYANQAWNEEPTGRTIWIAWMNNWRYAREIPTSTWRGSLTFPRQVGLKNTDQGIRLLQEPVREIEKLRGKLWRWQEQNISPSTSGPLATLRGQTLEILAEFSLVVEKQADRFGLRVGVGENEQTTIGYDVRSQRLFVNRMESMRTAFNPDFGDRHTAEMSPIDDSIRLRILIDRSSVEVFGNDGCVTLTDRIFPDGASDGVSIYAEGGSVLLRSLIAYELKKAVFVEAVEPVDRYGEC